MKTKLASLIVIVLLMSLVLGHCVPDLVARICGICPVAYQMSAVHALESSAGLQPGGWVRDMRRLLYCGEWIESHCLHIHLLAAPDFLGFPNAAAMAREYPEEVRRGLQLQHLGNEIMELLGGRSVHSVGACIGGFHRAPSLAGHTSQANLRRRSVAGDGLRVKHSGRGPALSNPSAPPGAPATHPRRNGRRPPGPSRRRWSCRRSRGP